ncbi:molecular chaperone GrpE [Halomicrobium zhouii]|uniref:Protein GrpE n=1 Tax=Halomicrobium zhouii TaxID=767519 RepID=A0A1I6LID8_9EURY|nr:nucleotide exchange factor GrpE [Halomicrobium zhouii]SFS03229.1 molecular chaperone GrpE [Halomicrobium zhouii]
MSDQDESGGGDATVEGESAGAGDGSEATPVDGDAGSRTDGATGEAATDAADEFDGEVDEALVERVAESDPADVARELASLRTRIDGLEGELEAKESENEDLTEKLKRKQADFQNYKKRMEKRREDEQQRATADLVTRLLDVRDNLKRALDQDEGTDIRGGVESTLRQFDDELAQENVDVVEPEPGEDVDPHRHEVLVRVDSDQPEGTIAEVHRPGYVMADSVLREAQVTVSDGSGEE